ncbi:MAG: glycosyltransferase family 2 protein [Bacteroidetes bacterium]|nr:glycosyltransferase family 2 protein [Flavobacteriales bacterium]NOG95935.1 glycosyltransferase family 2 protein [Bacteroidota bacterium]
MKLSVIIPLYNEEFTINKVISELNNVQMPSFINFLEILVVDDASTDHSLSEVEKIVNQYPAVKILKQTKNKGKGAAVRLGFSKAEGDILLVQDADLELNTADIPVLINAMYETGVEFVNGSRYMPGIVRPLYSYKRYLANKFFSFLTSFFINVRITDMACGYKLIKKSLLERINLKENRFGFEAELLIKALREKKNNIAEVPVHYYPRNEGEGKKIRNADAFLIMWVIIKYAIFRLR